MFVQASSWRPNCLGATRKNSSRLTAQLEAVLDAIDVLALEAPVDAMYGGIRASLERTGQPIGANDLLIAAHALTLGHAVVADNEREFLRIADLRGRKLAKVTTIVQPRN
jgi:tRNA(fMet)-specific endonuclease VapC